MGMLSVSKLMMKSFFYRQDLFQCCQQIYKNYNNMRPGYKTGNRSGNCWLGTCETSYMKSWELFESNSRHFTLEGQAGRSLSVCNEIDVCSFQTILHCVVNLEFQKIGVLWSCFWRSVPRLVICFVHNRYDCLRPMGQSFSRLGEVTTRDVNLISGFRF